MKIKRSVFITGSDTGVGKTVVAGLLARYLQEKGRAIVTQKWVETGVRNVSADINVHLKFMGKRRKDICAYNDLISPYVFKYPASPHLAARIEKKKQKWMKSS